MRAKTFSFRLPKDRLQRHLRLAAASLLLVSVLYLAWGFSQETWVDIPDLKAENPRWRLSMALAYSALGFFSATLLVGPLRVLQQRSSPANQMLRRDLGIWTAGLALAHISASAFIHIQGWKLWGLFLWSFPSPASPFPIRRDAFGLANFAGLAQASLLILLLLISNDVALRKLGTRRWKNIQRLAYLAFGLVTLHGLLYQSVEQRAWTVRFLFAGVVLLVLVLQAAGLAARARKKKPKLEDRPGVGRLIREKPLER